MPGLDLVLIARFGGRVTGASMIRNMIPASISRNQEFRDALLMKLSAKCCSLEM